MRNIKQTVAFVEPFDNSTNYPILVCYSCIRSFSTALISNYESNMNT